MNIITTPMCKEVLDIANVEYTVELPGDIEDADLVITISEIRTSAPQLSVKLNTYDQLLRSITTIASIFNSPVDKDKVDEIRKLIDDNNQKKSMRDSVKVKVYGNFIKDTVEDMGFTITDTGYDFVVKPDYLQIQEQEYENCRIISVASHKNVPREVIRRLKERYELLENKLCMQQ